MKYLTLLLLAGCSSIPTKMYEDSPCSEPRRFNYTNIPWDNEDEKTLWFNVSHNRCASDGQCLKTIHKARFNHYEIRCGEPE